MLNSEFSRKAILQFLWAFMCYEKKIHKNFKISSTLAIYLLVIVMLVGTNVSVEFWSTGHVEEHFRKYYSLPPPEEMNSNFISINFHPFSPFYAFMQQQKYLRVVAWMKKDLIMQNTYFHRIPLDVVADDFCVPINCLSPTVLKHAVTSRYRFCKNYILCELSSVCTW